MLVFERAKKLGQPYERTNNHQQLAAISDMVIAAAQPLVVELQKMANVDVEQMDQQGLEAKATAFIRRHYEDEQTLLGLFCQSLKRSGFAVSHAALDKHQELTQWLEADAECIRLLEDLRTSSEAKALDSARNKYFATGFPAGKRRWEQGWQ